MDYHNELVDELKQFLDRLQRVENANGATSLILKYGRAFRPLVKRPPWLRVGEPRQCFRNATAHAVIRADVHYAEGYAFEPELPIPVQHAWLVNTEGDVIDPTWQTTKDHVYFGMAFSQEFFVYMLAKNNGEAGVLVNLHLLRRLFRLRGQLEREIKNGLIKVARPKTIAQ